MRDDDCPRGIRNGLLISLGLWIALWAAWRWAKSGRA